LWVSLAIFGVVGLSLNAFLRPEGRAQRFAVVTTVERVLVEEVLPAQGDGSTGEAQGASVDVGTSADASVSAATRSVDGGSAGELGNADATTADATTTPPTSTDTTTADATTADATTTPAASTDATGDSLSSDAVLPAKPKRKWVAPDDAGLASGTLQRVSGVEPIVWETRESVKPAEAELRQADLKQGGPVRIEASPIDTLGVWVAALLTLFILSFVYRDNPFYKIAESILIGVSAAYWMVVGLWSTIVPQLFGALAPDMVRAYALPSLPVSSTPGLDAALAFVPLALGFMLLWRLAPKGGWISVWPIAFIIGTTAGIRLVGAIEADLMRQIVAAMKPLVMFEHGVSASGEAIRAFDFWASVGSVVGVVGVLSVLTYFFFSVEHKGAVGKTARVGIWFLMISFGSAFGLTVMGRITLLLQRFEFLFTDWLGIG
jgi:hypothetical protein